MQHVTAALIALIMIGAVLGITLGVIGGATLMQVLLATVVLVAVAYPVGDLIVLRATNNWVGIVVDAVTAALVLRLTVPAAARGGVLFWSVLGVAVGVYFFHKYLYATVLRESVSSP